MKISYFRPFVFRIEQIKLNHICERHRRITSSFYISEKLL